MLTFTQLKKNMDMDMEQVNSFCKKVAEEYANSSSQFSRSYFCKYYNLTQSCYYKVLKQAVEEDLINDAAVQRMINKSIGNQKMHAKDAGSSTMVKYANMKAKRHVVQARKYATEFAYNPDISKMDLAASHGVTLKHFDELLVIAVERNIVDDNVVDAMEMRSIMNAKPGKAKITEESGDGICFN